MAIYDLLSAAKSAKDSEIKYMLPKLLTAKYYSIL